MTYSGFERTAAAVGGTIDLAYHLGGYRACLRFAGNALVPLLTPTLAHLAADSVASPDFTVHVWDSTSTGTPLPLLIGSLTRPLEHYWFERLNAWRELTEYSDERICTTFHPGPNVLCALDYHRSLGCYWVQGPSHCPYWEASASLYRSV